MVELGQRRAWSCCTALHSSTSPPPPPPPFTSDADIRDESFLEYVNQALGTGEVVGMYTRDEVDAVVADMRPIFHAERPGNCLRFGI